MHGFHPTRFVLMRPTRSPPSRCGCGIGLSVQSEDPWCGRPNHYGSGPSAFVKTMASFSCTMNTRPTAHQGKGSETGRRRWRILADSVRFDMACQKPGAQVRLRHRAVRGTRSSPGWQAGTLRFQPLRLRKMGERPFCCSRCPAWGAASQTQEPPPLQGGPRGG